MSIPESEIGPWIIADLCSVGAACGKNAVTERRFKWQIAGAIFLDIYLRVCDEHAALVDAAKGEPFPVSCVISEEL
jgi:hypothetical protein